MKRKFRLNTPEEEAAIQRGIAQDPDNPEWTEEDFKRARPAAEMLPPELYRELTQRRRGPQKAPTKVLVSLRLDRDVVEKLRATGQGWQTRANELLRKAISRMG
jgi:uncharacterized protein (DUF4415 family)